MLNLKNKKNIWIYDLPKCVRFEYKIELGMQNSFFVLYTIKSNKGNAIFILVQYLI